MNHDDLGEIRRIDGHDSDGVATIRYGSRDIQVQMIADDQPFEITIELAAEVIRRLPELDKLAKRIAVPGLCTMYNAGWNEYDEVQEDGSLKGVSNPPLSEAEFEARLSLDAVNITGERVIEFFYDDGGMFWGHSVMVSSLDGVEFGEAHAELVG